MRFDPDDADLGGDLSSVKTEDLLSQFDSGDSSSSEDGGRRRRSTRSGRGSVPPTPSSGYSSNGSASAIHTPTKLSKRDMPYDLVDYVIGDIDEDSVHEHQKEKRKVKRMKEKMT